MKEKNEFLVETDILLSHLSNNESESVLEIAMRKGVCYTTVLNSAELFFNAVNDEEKKAVTGLLSALKVLGLNSRYSLNISDFFYKVAGVRDALICATAKYNNLPILTGEVERFRNSGIVVITPNQLRG